MAAQFLSFVPLGEQTLVEKDSWQVYQICKEGVVVNRFLTAQRHFLTPPGQNKLIVLKMDSCLFFSLALCVQVFIVILTLYLTDFCSLMLFTSL